MKLTDIVLESHIVSEGELNDKQMDEIEQLLENATEVNLNQIAQVLENNGHKVIRKHAHSIKASSVNTQIINEENEDFLIELGEMVKNKNSQSTQQDPSTKV